MPGHSRSRAYAVPAPDPGWWSRRRRSCVASTGSRGPLPAFPQGDVCADGGDCADARAQSAVAGTAATLQCPSRRLPGGRARPHGQRCLSSLRAQATCRAIDPAGLSLREHFAAEDRGEPFRLPCTRHHVIRLTPTPPALQSRKVRLHWRFSPTMLIRHHDVPRSHSAADKHYSLDGSLHRDPHKTASLIMPSSISDYLTAVRYTRFQRTLWKRIAHIEDKEFRTYCDLMAIVIFTYRNVFRMMSRQGIDTIVEVGTGRASLPAVAITLLEKPLRYVAVEPSTSNASALSAFCLQLGLKTEILGDRSQFPRSDSSSSCLVFEHSLEDIFLCDHHLNLPTCSSSSTRLSEEDERLLLLQLQSYLDQYLFDLYASSYRGLLFHHFRPPYSSASTRDQINIQICQFLENHEVPKSSFQWAQTPVDAVQIMSHEVWSDRRRRFNGNRALPVVRSPN